jgi:TonB family protein
MTPWRAHVRHLAAALAVVVMTAASASAQDSLASARDLYASAAYEDALAVLNRLHATDQRAAGATDGRVIEQYRAFCLLALGRSAEAEHAIEAVVAAEPTYHPSNTDVSPRVRSAFSDVRRRMLPAIIQQNYADAKAAFDRREFAAAADRFAKVLDALADPDVGAAVAQPPLSDIHTLAVGFHDLSVRAAAPPPVPTPAPPPPPPSAPPVPVAPRIYEMDDSDVRPPVIVNQALPQYPTRPVPHGKGTLELVINESGAVESALMRGSVNSLYDTLALSATRLWRYKPATLNGVPVKFRKNITITLKAEE